MINLLKIKQDALVLINIGRVAVGWWPLEDFSKGICNDGNQCTLAKALPGGLPLSKLERIASVWHTRVVINPTPRPGYSYLTNGREFHVKLPAKVHRFMELFDSGRYPELIDHEPRGV